MWIRRSSAIAALLLAAALLVSSASQSVANDGNLIVSTAYDICQYFPWWPGCL